MIKLIASFFKLTFTAKPSHFLIVVLRSLLNTFTIMFSMYSVKLIMDYLVEKSYEQSLYLIGAICLVNLVKYFLDRLLINIQKTSEEVVRQRINQQMARKLTSVDYEKLEDPYYLDLKERAKFALDNQGALYSLIESLSTAVSAVITISSLIVVIALFNPWLLAIVIFSLVVYAIITTLTLKSQLSFYNEIMPINRKLGYYINTLMDEKNAKEFRFSKINLLLEQKEMVFVRDTNKFFNRFTVKNVIYKNILSTINYAQQGFTYGYISYQTLIQSLALGDFTFYSSSVLKLTTETNALIDLYIEFKRLSEYIKPFMELIRLDDAKKEGSKSIEDIKTIEFKNVTFRYPKTEKDVLTNISFKVERGQKISVVGFNGAGKTTLIKLLTRLYRPQSGEILINDLDIRDYKYADYMKKIAAVFQDFSLFAYSIMDNVSSGDNNPNKTTQVIKKVGVEHVLTLDEGINSMISKSYHKDGIQLSGGQEQKLAIARALYKDSELVILDEPTSALDPMAEAQIYEQFNQLVSDKTAFYISHRMSSSVFCDKILVLNEGKVESFDTHQKLMKNKESLYYKLFMTQAKNYQA